MTSFQVGFLIGTIVGALGLLAVGLMLSAGQSTRWEEERGRRVPHGEWLLYGGTTPEHLAGRCDCRLDVPDFVPDDGPGS